MTNSNPAPASGKVLLGAIGDGDDWQVLRNFLSGIGLDVEMFDPAPALGTGRPEAAMPLLEAMDLVVVMAPPSGLGSSVINQNISHLAGRLGDQRVLTLRESGGEPVPAASSGPEIEYHRGAIGDRFPQVQSTLGDMLRERSASREPAWREWLGVVDTRVRPEQLMAAGAAVLGVAALSVVVVLLFFFPRGSPELGAELAQVDDVVVGPTRPGGSVGPEGSAPAGPGPTELALGSGGVGSAEVFPVRCVVTMSAGEILPDVVPCEGDGGLRVLGHRGPWHLTLHHVVPDLGVVGEAVTGSAAVGARTRHPLDPEGENHLPDLPQGDGVLRLDLQFSADGQRVYLEAADTDGGQATTLVFSLALG